MKRAILYHEASKSNKLHAIKKCYRWKEDSVEIYHRTIVQKQIQSLLDNIFQKGVNLAEESLNSIFDIAANISS